MQAAIDRVLRNFAFKPQVGCDEVLRDDQAPTGRAEAAAIANSLLENYKSHLTRRGSQTNR